MRTIILLCLFSCFALTHAQDLTGFWKSESEEATSYHAELHMIQGADGQYYGHSYDRQNAGFCRHWFKATFKNVYFNGRDNELIEKTPDHEATLYNLRYEKTPDGEFLTGEVTVFTVVKEFPFMLDGPERIVRQTPNFVRFRKVNDEYKPYTEQDFPDPVFEPTPEIPIVVVPEEEKPIEIEKETRIESPEEEIVPQKEIQEKEDLTALKLGRKEKLVSSIRLKSSKIRLEIKDFGTEDKDTVTIFLNDSILAKKIQISRKADVFEFELPKDRKNNSLVFVANNLGEIPPNSAEIRLYIDEKEFYYKLFTDDKFNAVIRLEQLGYRQKE